MKDTNKSDEAIELLCQKLREHHRRSFDNPPDYTFLSTYVQNNLGDNISISTLKRLFGYVSYNSTPYTTTLNILSRSVGYIGWVDFCEKNGL